MPKLQVEAHELHGTDVNFVSLVKRGANRLPFRIVKEDQADMLNLADLQRVFKKADPAPRVVAAVVRKGADLEAAKLRLGQAGLTVDDMQENGELIVFRQPNVESANDALVKLDDDIGLVVSGLAKAFSEMNIADTDFGKVFATEAFFPSMRLAKDMLGCTVGSIMQKAETPGEAASLIAKAVDDFKTYVSALAAAIPQHAFKADLGKADLDQSAPVQSAATQPAPVVEPAATEPAAVEPGAEPEPVAAPVTPDSAGDPDPQPVVPGPDSGAEAAAGTLLESMEASLEKGFGSMRAQLTAAVAGVRKDLDTMAARIEQVEQRTQKTEIAVNGTVAAEAGSDRTGVQKAAARRVPPLLDTAFMKLDQQEAA